MSILQEPLAERVKRLRLARGWTQVVLAEKSGVPQPTISNVERGREPLLETSKALADAFGVPLDDFDPYARFRSLRAKNPGWRVEEVAEGDAQYGDECAECPVAEVKDAMPTLWGVLRRASLQPDEAAALELLAEGIEARRGRDK